MQIFSCSQGAKIQTKLHTAKLLGEKVPYDRYMSLAISAICILTEYSYRNLFQLYFNSITSPIVRIGDELEMYWRCIGDVHYYAQYRMIEKTPKASPLCGQKAVSTG
jgi:hypothetical protein